MGKVGLAIKIILASVVALMLLGFVIGLVDGGYHTSLNNADAKITEAFGYFSAAMELSDQERFNAADTRLDSAVTAISMAELSIDDAKDMGAPKGATDPYDAVISYTKGYMSLVRSGINIGRLTKEAESKGYSENLKQRMITEVDKTLTSLDSIEGKGQTILEKYPAIAAELEVANDIKEIRSMKKDYQDLKRMLQKM